MHLRPKKQGNHAKQHMPESPPFVLFLMKNTRSGPKSAEKLPLFTKCPEQTRKPCRRQGWLYRGLKKLVTSSALPVDKNNALIGKKETVLS